MKRIEINVLSKVMYMDFAHLFVSFVSKFLNVLASLSVCLPVNLLLHGRLLL